MGILMYISNLYVGSIHRFNAYINNRLREYSTNISKLPFFSDETFIGIEFPSIVNETPEKDFDSMVGISSLEINVAGSLKLMESIFKSEKDDTQAALHKLVQLAQNTRSSTIKLYMSAARTGKELDKKEIENIFRKMRLFFQKSFKDNKFVVKGKIDDDVRFLDLLNADYFHKTTFEYKGRYVPIDEVFDQLYSIMDRYQLIFKKIGF